MQYNIVVTNDGSSTIYNETLNEHYHSINGAIQESLHVFIDAGLKQQLKFNEPLSVLEIGFGTGLNTLLTCIESVNSKTKIEYTTLEKFPLNENIVTQLNYCNNLVVENCTSYFNKIHSSKWNQFERVNPYFLLFKTNESAEVYQSDNKFDVIYFDAFSPNIQPELWTEEIFANMYQALKPNGILVTYCAKGVVKRNLKKTGFKLESIQGPVGKREMTRAHKII